MDTNHTTPSLLKTNKSDVPGNSIIRKADGISKSGKISSISQELPSPGTVEGNTPLAKAPIGPGGGGGDTVINATLVKNTRARKINFTTLIFIMNRYYPIKLVDF